MYFKSVKKILDSAIAEFVVSSGQTKEEICKEIGSHLTEMSKQHKADSPTIPYDNPLCRLGYIYRHLGANATLFQWSLKQSPYVRDMLYSRAGEKLRVCAIGGGPGSELLGLTKYIVRHPYVEKTMPKRIDFVLLDLVAEWGESWNQLSETCEAELATAATENDPPLAAPAISPQFHPMDVTDVNSYKNYAWLFANVDLVVMNYLISENLDGLADLQECLRLIASKARAGAAFLFIDRKEHSARINSWLETALPSVGLEQVGKTVSHGGYMDSDEQINPHLGGYPTLFGTSPRVQFQTPANRDPTAFSIVAKKPS